MAYLIIDLVDQLDGFLDLAGMYRITHLRTFANWIGEVLLQFTRKVRFRYSVT